MLLLLTVAVLQASPVCRTTNIAENATVNDKRFGIDISCRAVAAFVMVQLVDRMQDPCSLVTRGRSVEEN